jgi:hypothetical protein
MTRAALIGWLLVCGCGPEIAPNAIQQQDEMQKLRGLAQHYPVEALHQLGVTDGQIDGLFVQWAAKKREQVPLECERKNTPVEPPIDPKPDPKPEPPPPVVDPIPNLDKIAKPWWCARVQGFTRCFRTKVECDDEGACGWRERAACVDFLRVLERKKAEWCTDSFEECKRVRGYFATKTDDIAQLSACVAK